MSNKENNIENHVDSNQIQEEQLKERTQLLQILGQQVLDILHNTGLKNLKVEEDGSISGEITEGYYPEVSHVRNISLIVKDNKIIIGGDVVGSLLIRVKLSNNCNNEAGVVFACPGF